MPEIKQEYISKIVETLRKCNQLESFSFSLESSYYHPSNMNSEFYNLMRSFEKLKSVLIETKSYKLKFN